MPRPTILLLSSLAKFELHRYRGRGKKRSRHSCCSGLHSTASHPTSTIGDNIMFEAHLRPSTCSLSLRYPVVSTVRVPSDPLHHGHPTYSQERGIPYATQEVFNHGLQISAVLSTSQSATPPVRQLSMNTWLPAVVADLLFCQWTLYTLMLQPAISATQ